MVARVFSRDGASAWTVAADRAGEMSAGIVTTGTFSTGRLGVGRMRIHSEPNATTMTILATAMVAALRQLKEGSPPRAPIGMMIGDPAGLTVRLCFSRCAVLSAS